MTVNEQVLALASLEQDGEPKIPGLRERCKRRPDSCYMGVPLSHPGCISCRGRGWLPIDPQRAGWALAEHYEGFVINTAGAWVWPEIDCNGYYGIGEHPWESLIDAAYKAEIGGA
jgi:hypothetical protein